MRMITVMAICSILLLIPSLTHAQERVTIDINNIGGRFTSGFNYSKEVTLLSGKTYDVNGIEVKAKVAVTNIVSIVYRYEHAGLHNAHFFSESGGRRGLVGRQTEPDLQSLGGVSGYWELSGSLKLPKTHGHFLVVGLAKTNLRREFVSDEIGYGKTFGYTLHASHTGLMVGGEGRQKLSDVAFEYGVRLYPYAARNDYRSSSAVKSPSWESSSSGYELHGSATWMFAKHFGLTGGYEFRQLRTGAPNNFWPINENQTTKGFVIGTRFSF